MCVLIPNRSDEGNYICCGDMKSEWITCPETSLNPPRIPFILPQEMRDRYVFLYVSNVNLPPSSINTYDKDFCILLQEKLPVCC